ncbi:NAD(P)-dependent oxidoreductase [Psychrobacillus vulpis]|uniref:NAD-dependent epimerase/dehydratase family protein n=1 Tax=Psychrobacillus vulpis TaxID=2325572 RepID=A0A544TIN3_9BACI|nr:NAD(P)H-binding protein [Psychrobacillus vulpis]TQR17319.1 NAD-dependent epimerase/dehydratase family protein [Psychrobacillus vulpis]
MKIALFGSTGRVGSCILNLLLQSNHEVTALVRTPEKLEPHRNLTILRGDAKERVDIERALEGTDAVVSALGTDQTTVLTDSVAHIISIMEQQKVKRIVTIGTGGILRSRESSELLRYQSTESKRKSTVAAKEHHKVYEMLNASTLDWTIVCPTYLPTGEATNAYIVERDMLPMGAVQSTTGDTALFAYNELFENKYIGHRVGIMSPK